MVEGNITVIKNDHHGREVWRYEGVVLESTPTSVTLEALFNVEVRDLGFMVLRRGDRFVETFHTDRWYCIFEIHDRQDDVLKGWYCNFQRPAALADGRVSADDLALDLFVYPDHRMLVLDEDEFATLALGEAERVAVLAALDTLQARAAAGEVPFRPFRNTETPESSG
jgi:predicted RNA-binding protein associated with RNAse of E/G family